MIQSLRQIKSRIRSIENTKKLTRAMEMISVSKLKRTGKQRDCRLKFSLKVESLLKDILSSKGLPGNPFLDKPQAKEKTCFCVITSDTGLCGNYNNNILRAAEAYLNKYPVQKINLVTVGKKGFVYFKKKDYFISNSYIGFNGRYSEGLCLKILDNLKEIFISGQVDGVHIIYARPQSASRSKVEIEKFLSIGLPEGQDREYIFEPGLSRILEELIPLYLTNKFTAILLDAFTAEHQARSIAMGEATRNATELLEALILLRNKVRQANITREIIEIISSAEALKGQ